MHPTAADMVAAVIPTIRDGIVIGPVTMDKYTLRGAALCPWHEEQTPSLAIDCNKGIEQAECLSCGIKAKIMFAAIDHRGTFFILKRKEK
jgi:hypothetical protein